MAGQKHFEKVLGDTQYVTFNWYQRGLERCRAVARIETELETDRGEGTGFLVRGGDLKESWGDQRLLLTNAHVVSNDVNVKGALRPEKARISFKALGSGQTRYRIKQLLWTSPPSEFDATLIEMDGVPSDVETYPLSPVLPTLDEGERVYIIGHPKGGTLSFSINDNRLLDYQDRWIHYRAPTEGGSSGSPVFNRDWELIALHHAGGLDIPKLNNKEGNYAANEGIWIQAIRKALE
jgi:V8-like Glu-specific endopeptidase